MKPKRIISFLLAICLVVGLMPTAAFAAGTDTGKAIQLGTSGISDPTSAQNNRGRYYTPSDYVYFGVKGSDPIKWRVLDADKTNDGTTSGMFLLSEYLLDRRVVFERAWNSNDNDGQSNPNEWQHSDAQNWCSTFATNTDVFSTAEQAAFLGVTKTDNSEGSLYSSGWGTSSLTENDKVFFLSVRELADYVGNYDGAPGLRATDTAQSAGAWWLRSPYANYAFNAGLVAGNGLVSLDFVYSDWAARPAFNLDLESVLFTSAAAGGKSASGMDSGLTAVDDYTGNEWKLTLLDSTRNFVVTEQTVSGKPGDTITLNYTGATTGENEYISVIIADENGAQYYGRVAQPGGESGTATLSIPADLAPGSYTLNVFSEQYNGDYKTDYASAFAEVALTVEEAAAPGIDTGKAIQLVDSGTAANIGGGQSDNIYFGTYQQSSDESGGYNVDPIKWRVLSNASGQLFLLSDQNLDVFQYHTDLESVTWEKSTMRSWLNGYGVSENIGGDSGTDYTSDHFIGTAFSEKEQKAIAETEVVNDDNPTYGTEGGDNTNDKIFLLSIAEANNGSYFANDSSRIATNTAYVAGGGKIDGYVNGVGEADYWWLRSPGDYDDCAALVDDDGGVTSLGAYVYYAFDAVRPAFNLDLTSVLFTSAAEGGKSSAVDGNLRKVATYDGNEWKLTLLDEARNSFEISNATITDTITFSYSGAATGTNEYISAVVVDNGAITHYGRILQPRSTSGTASFTIPDGVTLSDTVKLYVFNEQYNSDKMTDYASQLKEISRPTVDTTAPKLTAGDATRTGETTATVKFTSSEAGSYYYEVVNSGENQPTIDTDGTGTTCGTTEQTISLTNLSDTSAKDIYIVVKDAAGNVSQPLKITIPAIYTLTVNLNGGSGNTTGGVYPAGEVVNIDAGSRSNYRFTGWTTSTGGSFDDASSASTTFTMPAADTTITATWSYNGGGGGYSDDDDEPDQPADPDDTGVSDLLNTEDHIQYLFGYPDGTFGPENNMTRAEVAQMFYNLLLDQDVEVTKTFDDVPANAWYTKAVNTLASLDIISGVGDNKFEPERSITRAEFTAMAMKFAVGGEEGKNIFSDVDENDWFYKAVVDSIQYGWIHGYGDGTFRPNNPITRAEVTAIVNNMLGRAADEDFVDEHAEELTQFSDIEKHWAYYHIAEATNDHDYTKPSSGENWTRLN